MFLSLSQINPVYAPTSHFLKIHLNILFSHLCLWLPSRFPNKTLYASLLFPIRATCPAFLIPLDLIIRIKFCEEYRSSTYSLCSFLHSPVTSSLLGPNILLSTIFSNAQSLCSSLSLNDQVSHPYTTVETTFHHDMARPQIAVGGTASDMEGSCEYIEYEIADSLQGAVPPCGGIWRGVNISSQ